MQTFLNLSQRINIPINTVVSAEKPIERSAGMRYAKVGQTLHAAVETESEPNQNTKHPAVTARKPTGRKHPVYSFFQRLFIFSADSWIIEVLSCALAIVALICLISVLRYFDGSVMTELPLHISINTLVATLAAMIKASVLLPVAEGTQLKI